MWLQPHSCTKCVRSFWMPPYMSLSELCTSPSLKRCSFKLQCPVSSPVIIRSRCLAQTEQFSSCFHSFCKKALSLSLSMHGLPALITTLATLADTPSAVSGPMSGCEEPTLVNWSAISFPTISIRPGTHTSWTMLRSASFIRNWGQSQTSLEFIQKLFSALIVCWLSERIYTRWFKYDRDWFVCKQTALRSSCATLREWSHNLHPPSCSG